MRIISGTNRGRKIIAPLHLPVRPTTDLAKESLFNILNNTIDFASVSVLDLFAGTGNISYEFASRGSKSITSLDVDFKCTSFIEKTAAQLNFSAIRSIRSDALTFLEKTSQQWDIIFADPPYDMQGIEELAILIIKRNLLKPGGMLIIEHDKSADFSEFESFSQHRKYGKVNFSFFVRDDQ